MEERRKYPRISEVLEVNYQQIRDFFWCSARSCDLSEGGIRLLVFQNHQPGIMLKLRIHLLDFKQPIACVGEVVWTVKRSDASYPFETGVKFIEINSSDCDRLVNYIHNKIGVKNNKKNQRGI